MKNDGAHKRIRRDPGKIKNKILEVLIKGPRTIDQIARKTNSHFPVTKKFINELMDESKIAESNSEKNLKVYLRKDYPVFYRIPVSKDQRDKTLQILKTIVEEYKMKKGDMSYFPLRTIIQKIAVDYIEENEPDLPVINFKFGKICCLAYNEEIYSNYDYMKTLSGDRLEKIRGNIEKFDKKNSIDAKRIQYAQKGMEFYKLKEEIMEGLESKDTKYEDLSKKFIEWSVYFPNELESVYHLFDKLIYCATNILRLKKMTNEKSQLKEGMDSLWNTLSVIYFFESSKKFIDKTKIELFNKIKDENTIPEIINSEMVIGDLKKEIGNIPENRFKKIDMNNKVAKLLHLLLED
ncbi:MAG: hypothetical protein IH845_03975 [Nanoarchaeota archaeon]|nr:hypothetical protein [Nanoarchaeota archaeon]